jgi:diacylglycerol O-acyltransferase / wax synthase
LLRNLRTRPTLIIAELTFNNALSVSEVRALFTNEVLKYPRFRSVLLHDESRSILHDIDFKLLTDDDIDMTYHVSEVGQEEHWDRQHVNSFISNIHSKNMDQTRPLWRVFVINSLSNGKHMLLACINHTIGDGVTMVEVLLGMLENKNNEFRSKINPAESLAGEVQTVSQNFSYTSKYAIILDGLIRGVIGTILPADPPNILKLKNHRHPGSQRCIATTGNISLDEVKRLKANFPGATVNDIFASLMTMTVRKYLEQHQDPILRSGRSIRATFAINMRAKVMHLFQTSTN